MRARAQIYNQGDLFSVKGDLNPVPDQTRCEFSCRLFRLPMDVFASSSFNWGPAYRLFSDLASFDACSLLFAPCQTNVFVI